MQEDKFLKRVAKGLEKLSAPKNQIPPVNVAELNSVPFSPSETEQKPEEKIDLDKLNSISPPGFKKKPTVEEVRKALESLGNTE